MKYLFLAVTCLHFTWLLAQPPIVTEAVAKKIDSLLPVIRYAKPDTGKVNALFLLGDLYRQARKPDDILRCAEEIQNLSRQLKYDKGVGMAYLHHGLYYHLKREYDDAYKYYQSALRVFKNCGDKKLTATCYRSLVSYFFSMGNNVIGNAYRDSALAIWKELGMKNDMLWAYISRGTGYTESGDYDLALENLNNALVLGEELKNNIETAGVLAALGFVYSQSDDDSLAIKYITEAAALYKKVVSESYQGIKAEFWYAENNITLGDVYLKRNNYPKALDTYNESLEIYLKKGAPPNGVPFSYRCIGDVYKAMGIAAMNHGRNEEAEKAFTTALDYYNHSIEKYAYAKLLLAKSEIYISMGETWYYLKQFNRGKEYLNKGLEGIKDADMKNLYAQAHLYLSKIDSAEGNISGAYYHFQKYNFYKEKMLDREAAKKVEFYKAKTRLDQKEKEIQLLSAENKITAIKAGKENQRRKFAYAAVALIVLLSAFGFYRYRRYTRLKSDQQLLKERLSISQDLHDNMGSTLSSISVFSKVAQVQSEQDNKEELQQVLDRIGETSGEMITEMTDIVWAINPHNDSMEKIIQRMESFAKPLLAARNMQFDFKYGNDIYGLQLDMGTRKNFYLIFKEAVNNAIKYSGAASLQVEIKKQNNHLVLLVKDNGVGFNVEKEIHEPSQSLSGNGLKNMYARAKEIKASLNISSSPADGTSVYLVFPLS